MDQVSFAVHELRDPFDRKYSTLIPIKNVLKRAVDFVQLAATHLVHLDHFPKPDADQVSVIGHPLSKGAW